MNKQILVAIAVILLVTNLALADQQWSTGEYSVQFFSTNTPVAQLARTKDVWAFHVYSTHSGGGRQVDVIPAGDIANRLTNDANGRLHVKTCGNPVVEVQAFIPTSKARNGKDGRDGTNGTNGRDGANGLDGQNGKDAVCPEQPAKPECTMRLPDRQSLPEQPQQCRPTFQPTLSVNFNSPEAHVTYAQFQREAGWGELLLGAATSLGSAFLGRAEGSVWNVAGGTAYGGNANATGGNGYGFGGSSSSTSQAGASANATARNRNNIRVSNRQGQTQSAASQSNPTQNQALNAPVAVAVD